VGALVQIAPAGVLGPVLDAHILVGALSYIGRTMSLSGISLLQNLHKMHSSLGALIMPCCELFRGAMFDVFDITDKFKL
jgi:hypothetical protein